MEKEIEYTIIDGYDGDLSSILEDKDLHGILKPNGENLGNTVMGFLKDEQTDFVLVACCEGQVVGFATGVKQYIEIETNELTLDKDLIKLGKIEVSPKNKRQGIGKKLFNTFCEIALHRNYTQLYFVAENSNEAQGFYQNKLKLTPTAGSTRAYKGLIKDFIDRIDQRRPTQPNIPPKEEQPACNAA